MALVSSSGSQTMRALGGDASGSTGKSQPPVLPNPVGQRLRIGPLIDQRLEILVIGVVAAEPFPGEVGRAHFIDMLISRGRAPAGCIGCHCEPPLAFELAGEEIPGGVAQRKHDARQRVMPKRHHGDQCAGRINSR